MNFKIKYSLQGYMVVHKSISVPQSLPVNPWIRKVEMNY